MSRASSARAHRGERRAWAAARSHSERLRRMCSSYRTAASLQAPVPCLPLSRRLPFRHFVT
eukprot:3977671-Pleurochrysis_carterae.AAC.1